MAYVECCGRKQRGRYCSDCGKLLQCNPISDLLTYLHRNAVKYESDLEKHENYVKTLGEEKQKERASHIASRRSIVEKWGKWRDALQALIDAHMEEPTECWKCGKIKDLPTMMTTLENGDVLCDACVANPSRSGGKANAN